MTPVERIERMLSMPNHRKPPIPERVSTLEELSAKIVLLVKEISKEVDKLKGGKPK